jgi:hypothetical protein
MERPWLFCDWSKLRRRQVDGTLFAWFHNGLKELFIEFSGALSKACRRQARKQALPDITLADLKKAVPELDDATLRQIYNNYEG